MKLPISESYERFLLSLRQELEKIPSIRLVRCTDGTLMAVNKNKRRACEIKDPRVDFPRPLGILYTVTRNSLFGKPKDFEQEGFTVLMKGDVSK